jgi:hypothetical protein
VGHSSTSDDDSLKELCPLEETEFFRFLYTQIRNPVSLKEKVLLEPLF